MNNHKLFRIGLVIAALCIWFLPQFFKPKPVDFTTGLASLNYECGYANIPCKVGNRDYHILLPDGDGPFPAVVYFHGSKQSGAKVMRRRAIGAPFLKRGYAVIALNALDVTYVSGKKASGWLFSGKEGNRDDYTYVKNVIADATTKFPIQSENLIVAGHSNGSTFVWYMACAGVLENQRYFATIGGTPLRGIPKNCAQIDHQINLLHTHGQKDTVVPLAGSGETTRWAGWSAARTALTDLSSASGCSIMDENVDQTSTHWHRCRTGADYRLELYDGGHSVPVTWADTVIDWYENPR
jgi:polyhydroxybutyrate depolymerase